ncbi:SLAM family member 7-like isoform X1 [Labeo rohita]|uniref:SLAM family member 7-like isoform X1 n=1 Tax=Labeo rohita TaxID=84645 RepID=A0A498N2L0_LABRO|nr:SLAM family member 7-like isoform X1 [Labeo rohita]
MSEDQTKPVGDTVSFRPANINPPVTSIIWKQRSSSGNVVKVIEWDDDGFNTPSPRFKNITTLDEKTGQITITKLTVDHSGVYTIDINSKEQEQRFNLKVMAPVPKPEIQIDRRGKNPDVVRLICEYNETVIWKNSTGKILKGSNHNPKGEFITVENKRNPDNFYTCTLKNAVSEETSDRVYERKLFKTPVPKPEIQIDRRGKNPDVVRLICEYNETVIWKNSTGKILKGSNHNPKGEFITVENKRNPDNFYTCTLKNAMSEETSDRVYERKLFKMIV